MKREEVIKEATEWLSSHVNNYMVYDDYYWQIDTFKLSNDFKEIMQSIYKNASK